MDPASGDTVGADVDGRFPVRRSGSYLRPDNSRMLLRPFHPGSDQRARDTIQRILAMPESAAEVELRRVMAHFSHEHADIDAVFIDRCRQLSHLLPTAPLSHGQSLLIGAYFMSEYSLQSALFNPSIVPHHDQAGVPADAVRFIMSLRAVGEGHLSSIVFRGGSIGGDGTLTFDPVAGSVTTPALRCPSYRKVDFFATLLARGLDEAFITAAFGNLPPMFDPEVLTNFLNHPERSPRTTGMSAYDSEHERKAVGEALN